MKPFHAMLLLLGFTASLSADILIPGTFNRPRPRPPQPHDVQPIHEIIDEQQPLKLEFEAWQEQYKRLQFAIFEIRSDNGLRNFSEESQQHAFAQGMLVEIHKQIHDARIAIYLLEIIEKVNKDIPANNRKQFQQLKQDYETIIQTIPPLPHVQPTAPQSAAPAPTAPVAPAPASAPADVPPPAQQPKK